MNSNIFDNEVVAINSNNSLLVDAFGFLADFIEGDIDADEFSNLLDLHIELSAEG